MSSAPTECTSKINFVQSYIKKKKTTKHSFGGKKRVKTYGKKHTLMISGRRPVASGDIVEPLAEPTAVVIMAADELCRDEKYS